MDKPAHDVCREWQAHPVTKFLLSEIDETISRIENEFSSGGYVSDTEFSTIKLTLEAVGGTKALNKLYEYIEELHEEVL